VVTHQLQVERRTGKVRRSQTDVLILCHATNQAEDNILISRNTKKSENVRKPLDGRDTGLDLLRSYIAPQTSDLWGRDR